MSSPRRSLRIMEKRAANAEALKRDPPLSCCGWTNKGRSRSSQTSYRISSRNLQPSTALPPPPPPLVNQRGKLLMIKHEPWDGPMKPMVDYNRAHPLRPTSQLQGQATTSRKADALPTSSSIYDRLVASCLKKEPWHPTDVTVNQELHNKAPHTPSTSLPEPSSTHPGLKRKTRDDEQQPTTSTGVLLDHLFCQLCQVSCSSGFTMQQHLIGRPHKAKMEYMQIKDGEQCKTRCDTCKIWCSDRAALEMHFKGNKHKKNVQELEVRIESAGLQKSSKEPILCELCCVPCMNLELYEMHLKGKKHAAKAQINLQGFH